MAHDVDEIIWYFDGSEEISHKFIYQLDDWGPIVEMTDERYKVEDESFWLW